MKSATVCLAKCVLSAHAKTIVRGSASVFRSHQEYLHQKSGRTLQSPLSKISNQIIFESTSEREREREHTNR